jgi:hypothetical protein
MLYELSNALGIDGKQQCYLDTAMLFGYSNAVRT